MRGQPAVTPAVIPAKAGMTAARRLVARVRGEARWEVAETGRRRKYYRITPEGRAQLAEERRQWQAVDATLRAVWQALASGAALPQGT